MGRRHAARVVEARFCPIRSRPHSQSPAAWERVWLPGAVVAEGQPLREAVVATALV